jgi:hypothetical protein
MDMDKLRELFARHGDAEKAAQGSACLRDQFKTFGIPMKARRELAKTFDTSKDADWDMPKLLSSTMLQPTSKKA